MRFRAVLATSFVFGAAAVSFAGCGIPAESNGEFVRGDGGAAGTSPGLSGNGGDARAGSAGTSAAGKAGSSTGGKGGSQTGKPCTSDALCADGNDCTSDACIAGFCSNTPLLPGSECDDDDDRCNGYGACEGTLCKPKAGTAPKMDDGDLCTDPVCDPKTGNVVHVAKVKATDDTKCTKTTCNPKTGAKEVTFLVEDDNDACTVDECDLAAGTVHTPIQVGDGDPCTIDSCDKVTGVKHVTIGGCEGCTTKDPGVDAPECADTDPCTYERCVNLKCEINLRQAGFQIDDDKNVCNGIDTCDAQGNRKKGTPLVVDDNDLCTKDQCEPSGKITHVAIDFDDKNQCTVDSCDPATGAQYQGVNADDGNACTTNDRCDPADPTNGGLKSDPIAGCSPCKTTPDCGGLKAVCKAFTCVSGVCVGSNVASDDECSKNTEPCKAFACDQGLCKSTNLPGNSCDGDMDRCNGTGTCNASGVCISQPAVSLNDNKGCTTGTCDPATGVVTQQPTGNGCQACTTTSNCTAPPAPKVMECVTPSCGSGENAECTYTVKTGPCGTTPAAGTCMARATCKGDGSCGAPTPITNCCSGTVQCTQPNDKCITASCDSGTCKNTTKTCQPRCTDDRTLTPASCDSGDGQCKDGAPTNCALTFQVCKEAGGVGSCGTCTRGTDGKDPRCLSGFCSNVALCCAGASTIPACSGTDDCDGGLTGCPKCGCTGGKTCKPAGGGGKTCQN